MASYGIPEGTLDWDVPLNADLNDIDSRITATETTNSSQAVSISANTSNIATNTADISTLTSTKVAKSGDTMSGNLAMGSNKITGLANGTAATDAAAFGQIPVAGTTAGTYAAGNDSRITGALQTTGGTMSGVIAMGSQKITGLANGTAASDAAAFGQIPTAGTGASNYTVGNDTRVLQAYNGNRLQSFLSFNYDPIMITATGAGVNTSGTVYLHKIYLAQGQTVASLAVGIQTAGSTLTSGQNFLGLYDSSGTRVGVTADQASSWTTTGYKPAALTVSYSVTTAGFFYVGVLAVGTTPPAFFQQANAPSSMFNANTTAGTFRHCTDGTGQTSLPASITLGTTASSTINSWVAAL